MEIVKDINVAFRPSGKKVVVKSGTNLLDIAQREGFEILDECGGRGTCGKCKVRIVSPAYAINDNEKLLLSEAEIESGIHLACQVTLTGDTEVELLSQQEKSSIRFLVHAADVHYDIDSKLKKFYLELTKPDINNPIDDISNFRSCLNEDYKNIRMPISLLQSFSAFLRKNDYKVTFVMSPDILINIEAGDTTQRMYGLAFDLGTTTIAGSLIDMRTGKELVVVAETNPQRTYGVDVISRINYAKDQAGGLSKLQSVVIETINGMIESLLEKVDVSFREIYEISLAGNTIMTHIFLGIDPRYIGEAPYNPTFRMISNINAEEVGLTLLPKAQVIVLPNISGYVGGDITALILAKEIHLDDKISLGIDIGTNGEIVLGSRQGIKCCSAAAGPAFEGGHISCGMRAESGAIDTVVFSDDNLYVDVIDNVEPKGICGTGLLDIVAGMLENGLIEDNGRIRSAAEIENEFYKTRLLESDSGNSFVVVPKERMAKNVDIVVTQRDIRELQLAKAAFNAGINILIKELGIDASQIERVYLAGAFGSYINKYSALTVGLLPSYIDPEKIHFVGNTAIAGARKYLLADKSRHEVEAILDITDYIELSMRTDFQDEFTDSILFKPR
ncbi:DUF4445 domain-containing protein [candidate division KSB1 bacterium]|nr:DUF4445 domain-containing protein [candidate division KSB1 bacterium]